LCICILNPFIRNGNGKLVSPDLVSEVAVLNDVLASIIHGCSGTVLKERYLRLLVESLNNDRGARELAGACSAWAGMCLEVPRNHLMLATSAHAAELTRFQLCDHLQLKKVYGDVWMAFEDLQTDATLQEV
jgi:hypothetical protein